MIDLNTNIIVGVAMADATIAIAPNGTFFVNLPDDSPAGIGWIYNTETQQFTAPVYE